MEWISPCVALVVLLLLPGAKQGQEMYLAGPLLPSFLSNRSSQAMQTHFHLIPAGARAPQQS
jgi:hypothetical protein